jgi:hypothetical protein
VDHQYYVEAIDWLADHVYANLPKERWKTTKQLSGVAKLKKTEHIYSSLIEFHHNMSRQIDYSFGMRSSAAEFPKHLLPSWWDTYLENCDHLKETPEYNSNGFKEGKNATELIEETDPQKSFVFPDYHFFEFDETDKGIKLSGIFQQVWDVDQEFNAKTLVTALGKLLAIRDRDYTDKKNEVLLRYLETFGCPTWLGLMIGRNESIKLIFSKNTQWKDSPETCWKWASNEFKNDVENTCNILNNIDDCIYRLCLDLKLTQADHYPRLCFEIFPEHPVQEAKNWRILTELSKTFSEINPLQNEIKAGHCKLPYGIKRTPFSHLFPKAMPTFERIGANLSHYKICMSSEQPVMIKSYISLVAEIETQ